MTSAWCSLIPNCAKEPGHEPPCVTVAEALRGEINVEARRDLERQEACGLAFDFGRVRTERDGLRDAFVAMHRRAQKAEGIIDASGLVEGRPQTGDGRSLGRALANYAADKYRRQRDQANADFAELRGYQEQATEMLQAACGLAFDHGRLLEEARTLWAIQHGSCLYCYDRPPAICPKNPY